MFVTDGNNEYIPFIDYCNFYIYTEKLQKIPYMFLLLTS